MVRSPVRAFFIVFVPAFAIRAYFVTKIPLEYILPHTRWEILAVAHSLATTGQFADPYLLPTGPTAHLAPVYPFLLSLIYRVFGMTLTAGYLTWLLAAASDAAVFALLPWLAGKLGAGRPAGLVGGLAGAVVPQWPALVEPLAAMVLGLLLIGFLRRWTVEGPPSTLGTFLFGIAWGVALHLHMTLLPVMLGCMAFELWWSSDRRRWLQSALLVFGVVLASVPWAVRNYVAFDEVVFIRSNFGLELRMGNHDGAHADIDVTAARTVERHPRTSEADALMVQELGEVEYMRRAGREAVAWIWDNPGAFLRLTISRFLHYWCGPLTQPSAAALYTMLTILAILGAVQILPTLAVPYRAALLIPLVTYPLVYYLVSYMPRYRVPLDWMLLMLAGWWVARRLSGQTVGPLDQGVPRGP
jgi:hypothetical protein